MQEHESVLKVRREMKGPCLPVRLHRFVGLVLFLQLLLVRAGVQEFGIGKIGDTQDTRGAWPSALWLRYGSTVEICSHDEVTRGTGAYYTRNLSTIGPRPVTRYTNRESHRESHFTG